jgi:hypothetical protein
MSPNTMQGQKQESSLIGLTTIIGLFEELQLGRQKLLRAQVKELLTNFPAVVQKSRALVAPQFNIVKMCGLGPDEVQHSFILAWLFNETASHGHGSKFFAAFASVIGLKLNDAAEGYSVYTEFHGFKSITDIVIYKASDFYVSVENKINAIEGHNQLNREYYDLERYANSLNIPADRRFAVFLTPDDRPPVTGDPKKWVTLSYAKIDAAFSAIPYKESSQKLRCFVEDWIASI